MGPELNGGIFALTVGLIIAGISLVTIFGVKVVSGFSPKASSVADSKTATGNQSNSARSDADRNPPGKPFQMANGWSAYMEYPIKASLPDPASFVFDIATPFELRTIQGTDYWISAIEYRAKNGSGAHDRNIGMILENDGHWQFYPGGESQFLAVYNGENGE
jgi:hypothetical protein